MTKEQGFDILEIPKDFPKKEVPTIGWEVLKFSGRIVILEYDESGVKMSIEEGAHGKREVRTIRPRKGVVVSAYVGQDGKTLMIESDVAKENERGGEDE
jgi:hypothetical protein